MFFAVVIRKEWEKLKLIATPGFLGLLIFMVISFVWCKGRMLSEGDEFSHWGRVTLNMYLWNQLGNCEGSTVIFPGYPPAVALWQYFFVCLKEKFSEPYLYGANNVLAFVMLVSVYKRVEWRQWAKGVFLFIVILVFPLIFYNNFWSCIYIDGLLGIWLIYILYIHFSEKEDTFFKVLQISLAMGTYPLAKASGSGLAFMALLIIAVDMLVCNGKRNEWSGKIKILLIYTSCILAGKQSWSWYLKLSDTQSAWNTSSVTLKSIADMLKGKGLEWQYVTVENFNEAFFQGREGLNVFHWILIIVFFAIFLYILKIWNCKQLFCYSGILVVCIILYALSLLILYCFTFTEVEAVILASYRRYMCSILLGMFGFIIFKLASENTGASGKVMLLIVLCLMVPSDSIKLYTTNLNDIKEQARAKRNGYEHIMEFSDFMDWKEDKIWLIDQGSSGSCIGGYCATPVVFGPDWGWSLGEPLYEGDVWTVNYSVEEWEDRLGSEGYTYVYINHQDEQFVENYSSIFEKPVEIADRSLYQIRVSDEGKIVLKLYKVY